MDDDKAAVEAALQTWDALGRMNLGAVAVRVARALDKVGSNLLDPNTPSEAKRQLIMKLTYIPTKAGRSHPVLDVTVELKLAPEESEAAAVRVLEGHDGVVRIVEDPPPARDPRQQTLPLEVVKVGATKEVVDFNARKREAEGA